MLYADQSLASRQQAIQAAKDAGVKIDPRIEQHILSAPAGTVKQYGANMMQAGQPANAAIEQSGVPAANRAREEGRYLPQGIPPNEPIISRTEAATGGRAPVPSSPAIMGDDEAVRKGLYSPTPDQIRRGIKPDGSSPAPQPSPNQTVASRFPNQSIFQPRVVRNPDGSISSSVTPETQGLQNSAVERFKQIQDTSAHAQEMITQLDAIEHENEVLNSGGGWSSTGAGANAKLSAAKNINSLFTSFGMQPPIDPQKVGGWEAYNKQTFRAGADLARTLGGHQAESIIQSAVGATPNVENTYFGSKVITSSIRQTAQRQIDMYRYSLDYTKSHGGSSFGAEDEFNRQFPPKLYSQTAVANAIPKASIDRLMASGGDAKNKSQFDSVYGSGMADFVLGHAR
jgi:hypothetical protein